VEVTGVGFAFILFGLPLFAGILAGVVTRLWWSGALAGSLLTIIYSFTIANWTILAWVPIHALLGTLGSGLVWLLMGFARRMHVEEEEARRR
jgi:hypothetical protein